MSNTVVFDYDAKLSELIEHHPGLNERAMIVKAFNYAIKCHEGQLRKNGEAFDTHPINVACILNQYRADYETICAALLHDTIEDCPGITHKTITEEFSETIADLVEGVTKISSKKLDDKELLKIKTINKLLLTLDKDPRIIIIKLADRLHNMQTIHGHNNPKKEVEKSRETQDIYIPLASLLCMYELKEALEDLSFEVLNHESYEELDAERHNIFGRIENFYGPSIFSYLMGDRNNNIESIFDYLSKKGINVVSVKNQFKNVYGISKGLVKNHTKDIMDLNDIITFKIVVSTEKEVYDTYFELCNLFRCLEDKNYVSDPKYNFYQAMHMQNRIVIDGKSYVVKFIIRTPDMELRASDGIASFWNYDETKPEEAKNLMLNALRSFPFFPDLQETCLKKERGIIPDMEFNHALNNLVFASKININLENFEKFEIYDGCTVKDLVTKLYSSAVGNGVEYYVNGIRQELSYVLKDNDSFRAYYKDADEKVTSIQRTRYVENK
ncbi:MAG: HD domain-containing protein [Bacilli bacterium]|nr:HD domain-containing protein [Bacilli bacterium]